MFSPFFELRPGMPFIQNCLLSHYLLLLLVLSALLGYASIFLREHIVTRAVPSLEAPVEIEEILRRPLGLYIQRQMGRNNRVS